MEHPFKDDTIVVTSTCLDDDQMVRDVRLRSSPLHSLFLGAITRILFAI